MAQIEPRNLRGDSAAVVDVRGFAFIRRAARQDAFERQQRPEKFRRVDQLDAFIFQHAGDGADQRIRIFRRQRKQQFREPPVRPDGAEDLVVLHLPGHHGVLHSFLMQQFDPAAELAQADPVETLGRALQRRRSLFTNGDHGHFDAPAARTFQDEKRKIAVAGDQAPGPRRVLCRRGHRAPISSSRVRPPTR